jgi:phage gpG-like protein
MAEGMIKISEIGTPELMAKMRKARIEIPYKGMAQKGGLMTIAYMKRHRFRKGGGGKYGVKRMPPVKGKLTTRAAAAGLMGSVHEELRKRGDGYDDIVGSPLVYAAIHEYGGYAGRNLASYIPKRPYLIFSAKKEEENWRAISRTMLLRTLRKNRLI